MNERTIGIGLMALGAVVIAIGAIGFFSTGDAQQAAAPTSSVETSTSTTTTSSTTSTTTTSLAISTTTTSSIASSTTQPPETAEEFLALFNAAFESGDVAFLSARINQATLDIYGAEQCDMYLDVVIQTFPPLKFRELGGVGLWNYVIDGITTPIEEAAAVEVSRIVEGQTIIQEVHWKLVDGVYTWFTDCGDPLEAP